MTQIKKTAELIGKISEKYNKPVFCSFIGGTLVSEGEKILNKMKIPSFRFPERAIYALGKMWDFKKKQDENSAVQMDIYQVLNFDLMPENVNKLVKEAMDKKHEALDNLESDIVISAMGINTPPTLGVENLGQAKEFAGIHGYPVVLKLSAPGLLHKKDVGGVVLDIRDEPSLEEAWGVLNRKKENLDEGVRETTSFQIQKEVPSGVEVIVGVKNDKTFGHVMLFGAGGSLAELISDKNLALLPMDLQKARKLVEGSKIFKTLKGKKEDSPFALEKLYELMVKLSKIVEIEPGIEEIEINPVIININDVWAVDTKVILRENKQMPQGPKFKTAKVLKAENLTEKMHFFQFESEEPLEVIPGQFLSVKVSETRVNCYSVAGLEPPAKFNLLVDSTPGGPGSKFFESLKVGDKMTFLGPFGNFTLKPNEDVENMLFFATGCGTAPLKYMIESALEEGNDKRMVKLYLGVNDFCDVFFKDYFNDLQKKYDNFSYEIAVNNPDPNWEGPTGFITALVEKDFPDASKCSAYLCGNKFMVDDVSRLLIERGCPEERIYTEKYGQ
jgi:NAD(P)H-flavin reductase